MELMLGPIIHTATDLHAQRVLRFAGRYVQACLDKLPISALAYLSALTRVGPFIRQARVIWRER